MQRAIINADDCGRSLEVDNAIVESMNNGEISSTTIMANGSDFARVKSIYDSHSNISFGAHLVLDELISLTKSTTFVKAGITDKDGVFIKGGFIKVQYTQEVIDAIFNEWCAQIEKILAAGIIISHIDSHHHVHVFNLELLKIVYRISKKYHIYKIRGNNWLPVFLKRKIATCPPMRRMRDSIPKQHASKCPSILTRCKSILKLYRLHKYVKENFVSTEYFMAAMTYYVNRNVIKPKLESKVLELMCHPGHQNYAEETKILASLKSEISLINYNEL